MSQPDAAMDPAEAPLVDRSALDPIVKVTGPAVMQRIVEAFWATVDEMLGALNGAIESGQQDEIRKAAHALKGASSNVGAGRTARLAAALESADPMQARAMMPRLQQSLHDTRPALDAILRDAA